MQRIPTNREEHLYAHVATSILRIMCSLILLLGWTFFLLFFMTLVVDEKEKGITYIMKISGLNEVVYW